MVEPAQLRDAHPSIEKPAAHNIGQDRTTFWTRADARLGVFDYIEAFYNPHRRHSALDYLSPVEFERRYRSEITAA